LSLGAFEATKIINKEVKIRNKEVDFGKETDIFC
jgi:hypothetical protein